MDPEGTTAPAPTQEPAEAVPPVEEERNPPAPEVLADAAAGEGGQASGAEPEEELAREVMELGLQNEYLRSQIAAARPAGGAEEGNELVRGLKEQVERLGREVQEQRQTREAMERALEHVNVSYAEADGKVQVLTAKLAEAQRKMEKEIKERDDKYVELDTKFQRLHKRAKQRIQDIQKEKEDLEARFNEINQKAEQATSLQVAAQQDLERARQQASDALRSMDAERQQLRTVNSKLRANLDEVRLALEARNNSLEKLQQSMLEKEQMLEKIQGSLQSAEDKRTAIVSELTAKHQKQLESLQAQLAEVSAERTKASETIQSLQEKERQSWEATCESLRSKLEASESAYLRSEVEFAKLKISRLQSEFSAYKVRAHALLQKKDAELNAAKNSDLIKAHEEAIREAEKEVATALAERDQAIHDLQNAQSRHDEVIEARDLALADAEKRLKNVMNKLDSVTCNFLSEKESWEKKLASVEEEWRLKCESLKAQSNGHVDDQLQKNFKELKLKHDKLKEEHESFRDISDRMIEDKEREIAKLLKENKNLHHSLEANAAVSHNDYQNQGSVQQDAMSVELAEQQILQEIEELERENRLHDQQEALLKAELRNMERSQKREGIDMTYLKNVILKLLETGEVGALLPVVATLLQFSPDELKKCQQGVLSSVISSQPPAEPDGASTPNSFFARFSF
ncbi:hypothetical protein PR202_gb20770 [Eleusine coracana subsp. coracana]|uniref:GRIP domain-containing protein n=1 Tax=Eleusine coracana subsp. coracana TaxID=191504 RepID=A0AAV5F9C4_ELECO|nr:hypothetical protein PR202_gb20770 [Eleusine coracana subsp. coracana]